MYCFSNFKVGSRTGSRKHTLSSVGGAAVSKTARGGSRPSGCASKARGIQILIVMHEKYIKRFNERRHIVESGCWEWTGTSRGKTGYGCLKVEGKIIDTHRLSFIIHKGSIPAGMLVCHSCDNRKCVNPEHLFLGTYKENYLDAVIKGRINVLPKNEHLKRHPGESAYQHGCRCDACRNIYNANTRKRRRHKTEPIP